MTAEKTSKPVVTQHQQGSGAFFRKAAEEGFFGQQQAPAFFSPVVQPKLSVSQPDDPQEREADQVAEHVMRMPEAAAPMPADDDRKDIISAKLEAPVNISRQAEEGEVQAKSVPRILRQATEDGEDKIMPKLSGERATPAYLRLPGHSPPALMRRKGRDPPQPAASFETTLSSTRGAGTLMPAAARGFMERRFGADFSGVRIHTGSTAVALNRAINAQAFTHGADIYFNSGKFAPESSAGKALLAHELTHTIQQGTSKQAPAPINPVNTAAVSETHQPVPGPEHDMTAAAKAETAHNAADRQAGANAAGEKNAAAEKASELPAAPVPQAAMEAEAPPPNAGTAKKGALPPLEVLMPEPPAGLNPASQRRLQQSQHRATQSAAAHSDLPPANKNVADARDAVEQPKEEINAEAGELLVAELGHREKPSPEILELCEKIRTIIREKRPPDEDSLVDAEPDVAAAEAGGAVKQSIDGKVDAVGTSYDDLQQTPEGTKEKEAEDIVDPEEKVTSADINATAAVPDAVPGANITLDADVASAGQHITESGMTAAPAQLVQDGPIAAARGAQAELEETAAQDPAAVEAAQQQVLAKAGADMNALQDKALRALQSSRAKTIGGVGGQQQHMKESEQEKRKRVGDLAQQKFNDAQKAITPILAGLSKGAMSKWDGGVKVASEKFKATLKKVKDWIDDRHSGVGGFFNRVGDYFGGLPAWVTQEYDRAEKAFGDDICELITGISEEVNTIIASCQLLLDNTQKEITKLFKDSFGELDEWAIQELGQFDKKIKELRDKADDTRNQLNKNLAGKAAKSVQDVRDEIYALREKAKGLIRKIADAIVAFIDDPAKAIIEGLLHILGIPVPAFWRLVNKIQSVIGQIADDPETFANNLMASLSQGFSQFIDHFATHLKQGFVDWLTSGFGAVGVQLPSDFSVKSMITFFLQLMGISWDRIRKLLAKQIGEENVELIEKAFSLIAGLAEKGVEGIIDFFKDLLDPEALLGRIMDAVVEFVVKTVMERVAIELLKLFNPVGAILKAIEAIYDICKWIFENAARIFTLIETIVNGVGNIMSGNIGGMATVIEKSLTMLIAPVIDFLAELVGLGDLPEQVAGLIKGFQGWVEGIMDKAITWLISQAKKLLKKAGFGRKEEPVAAEAPADTEVGKVVHFTAGNEHHKLWINTSGSLATVMMASDTPAPLAEKIGEMEQQLSEANVQEAKKIIAEIHGLNKTTANDAAGSKQKIKAAQAEGHTAENNQAAKTADDLVEQDEQKLARLIEQFMMLLEKPPVPKMEIHPGFSSAKADGNISVRYLLNDDENHNPGTGTKGSEDLHGAFTEIKKLNVSAYWFRGHLLNREFGGKAENSNLIPIPSSLNNGPFKGFDGAVSGLYDSKRIIWMDIIVSRNLPDDPDRIFVSHLKMHGGAMSFKNRQWEVAHDMDVPAIDQNIDKPKALGAATLSLNDIIRNRRLADIPEIGRQLNLSVTLVRALVDNGRTFSKVEEIRDFINLVPDVEWSSARKTRMKNRVISSRNLIDSNIHIL